MGALIEPASMRMLREHEEQMRSLAESPAMRLFIEQQDRIQSLVDPAVLKLMDERDAMQTALTTSFSHPLIEAAGMKSFVESIAESLGAAQAAISHSVFSTDFLEGIRTITAEHEAQTARISAAMTLVAEQFKPLSLAVDVTQFADLFRPVELTGFYESFKHIEEMTRAAQDVMSTVRLDLLGDLIGVVDPADLQLGAIRLNRSYASYAASIAAEPADVIDAPFMAQVPALAVYSHARVMRSITTHGSDEPVVEIWGDVQIETREIIETILPRIRPALLKSWKGGLATTRRRGDDWVRQASSSLRYVLIETLDAIAPKDKVLADGVNKKHLSEKGVPTRAGQVHWLCSSLKNKTYREMMVSELESAIEIIDIMNTAVHREDHQEIDGAFDRMCVRAEIALRDLLEIFKTRA
jgi:hypothetical protein